MSSFVSLDRLHTRRVLVRALPGLLLIPAALTGCAAQGTQEKTGGARKTIRLGYQSAGDLTLAKGTLEKRLALLDVGVQWSRFSSGPPLMEALNVGAIDMGVAGESPPIFAQAAGAKLVYVANFPIENKQLIALIVPKDSPARRVKDLKGKKVAFVQASAAQFFLVKALEAEGLGFRDVQAVNLPPSDAQTALASGAIDAWVTWDPFLLLAVHSGARVIRDATGISTPGAFYLASREFALRNSEVLKVVLDEIAAVGTWGNEHPREAAQLLSKQVQLDVDTLEAMLKRRPYSLRRIDSRVIAAQQEIADLYHRLGFLPKRIDIREATLTPEQYAQLAPESVL